MMRFQLIRTHRGHQDAICALAAVPGQPQVLSAARDGTLKEWDLRRDTCELIQAASEPYITALHIFPAGFFFASGDSQGLLKIWNLETGEIVRSLDGHKAQINALTITHSGRRLLSGSQDHTMRIWDALTGDLKHVCNGHDMGVAALALTPDDQRVLAGEPGRIKLWEVDTGTSAGDMSSPELGYLDMAVLRDGTLAVSHTATGEILIWTLETGETRRRIRPHFGPLVTTLMPDESHILVGAQTPSLSLWSLDTGENMYYFEEPPAPVTSLAVTSDSRSVLAGCEDGSLVVYMRVS